jgi:hypothetical protein
MKIAGNGNWREGGSFNGGNMGLVAENQGLATVFPNSCW